MSGRADIIALARTLGLQSTDAVLLDRFYTESLIELGETDLLLEPRFVPVVAGTAIYTMEDTTRIAALFFGTRELTRTSLTHLATFDRDYRTTQGTPRIYAEEHEDHNVIRLYPVPAVSTVPAMIFPDPMGANYPLDQIVAFCADRDETAAPWMDYPLALAILARDLAHQSAYRDTGLASAAQKLGELARQIGEKP